MSNILYRKSLIRCLPIIISLPFLIFGCGEVRYDNSTTYSVGKNQGAKTYHAQQSGKKYTVGPNDSATAKYSQRNDERSTTYATSTGGKRYTIDQYDKATAHYTLKKGGGHDDDYASGGDQSRYAGNNTANGSTDDDKIIHVEGMSFILDITDVLFDFDKSVIKKQFYPELDKWVEFFQKNPQVYAEIEGHADSTGPDTYNQNLSERRALAVIEYLVDNGVSRSRLTAKGYGEKVPVAPNTTREGRQQNRRVELNY